MDKTAQYLSRLVHYVPKVPAPMAGIEPTPEYLAEKAAIITRFAGVGKTDGQDYCQLATFLTTSSYRGWLEVEFLIPHSPEGGSGTFHFPEECTCED